MTAHDVDDATPCCLPRTRTGAGVTTAGADPGFWKGGGPTMEDSEMSRRSRQGDAEGVAGAECERGGVKPPLTGEVVVW